MAFTIATALYSLNISAEDHEKRQGLVDLGIKTFPLLKLFTKQRPEAGLVVITGNRFYIKSKTTVCIDVDQLKA